VKELSGVKSFLLLVPINSNFFPDLFDVTTLEVCNPKAVFSDLVSCFFPEQEHTESLHRIHPSVQISSNAEIHDTVKIGPNSVIGECTLKRGVTVGAGVQIFDRTIIGCDSTVYANCLIGTKDFSPVMVASKPIVMHPQLGGVRIGQNVEIFPNTTISRGTFEDTIIEDGVKIDHHCQISHNSKIGKDCVITSGVIICGSVSVGERCWVGPHSVVLEHIRIGNDVEIMIGSVVTKAIEPKVSVGGYPATVVPKIIRNS
jgi:UDP-3-O-[3-hydroxymyristoyl] glucosamine N-acyltransferase